MIARRALALVVLAGIALGACHKRESAADALDAGADARARTAARTLADLSAADRASAAPLSRAPIARPQRQAAPSSPAPPADESVITNSAANL